MKKVAFDIHILPVGQMQANCYLLVEKQSKSTIIVDPGEDAQYIIDTIQKLSLTPQSIIATHGHFDHIMGAFEVQQTFQIPFLLHKEDVFLVTRMRETAKHFLGIDVVEPPPVVTNTLVDREIIKVGDQMLVIHHTPGHTPGSICIEDASEGRLFVGDTIFADGGVGRTDFQYSKPLQLADSVRYILGFADATFLHPGHGRATTVAAEKVYHST